MNRLPRRSSKIQPPLRGRLAASLPPERRKCFSTPVTRPRPTIAKNMTSQPTSPVLNDETKPDLNRKRSKYLIWLIVLAIAIVLLFFWLGEIGRF